MTSASSSVWRAVLNVTGAATGGAGGASYDYTNGNAGNGAAGTSKTTAVASGSNSRFLIADTASGGAGGSNDVYGAGLR